MNWKPSIKQLEIMADMATPRLPSHKIAKMLGVDFEVFQAWAIRAASAVAPPDEPDDDWQPEHKKPVSPKIMAERLFETERD